MHVDLSSATPNGTLGRRPDRVVGARVVKQTCGIVVVGGGPVGAAAALALHRSGFEVALLERAHAPAAFNAADYDLRVYALSPNSASWLTSLGAWEGITGARASAYSAMQVWERGPEHALKFDAGDIGCAQLGWIVEHGLIVRALWDCFADLPVISGATIANVRFDTAGAHLQLTDGRELSARLCIAADGADSQLRKLAGIETVGWHYDERAIVCHVETELPHRATARQRFLKTGPLAFLPLADGRSSIVWSATNAEAERLLALDDAAFCDALGAAFEYALGAITQPTPRVAFPLRLQHARDYVGPGLALIGDAAHAIHPLAGQGVNLGFGDAHTLVDTLTQARDAGRDWSSPRTLARYTRARKAENLEMLAVTDTLDRVFRARIPGLRPALGMGLEAVNAIAPLRGLLARQAAV